jgi:hypothetical protein
MRNDFTKGSNYLFKQIEQLYAMHLLGAMHVLVSLLMTKVNLSYNLWVFPTFDL